MRDASVDLFLDGRGALYLLVQPEGVGRVEAGGAVRTRMLHGGHLLFVVVVVLAALGEAQLGFEVIGGALI